MSRVPPVSACYVLRSPTLDRYYRKAFPGSAGRLLVKIGRTNALYDRAQELVGQPSNRVSANGWTTPEPYAGVDDWVVWRIKQNLDGQCLEAMEGELHRAYSIVIRSVWENIYRNIGLPGRAPAAEELRIGCLCHHLQSDFPSIVTPMPEDGRE